MLVQSDYTHKNNEKEYTLVVTPIEENPKSQTCGFRIPGYMRTQRLNGMFGDKKIITSENFSPLKLLVFFIDCVCRH